MVRPRKDGATVQDEAQVDEAREQVDVLVQDEGSLYLFRLQTDEAQEWVEQFVDDPMYWGGGLVVEHRYAGALAEGMISDGLVLE